jgi:hypothetical protein
VVEQYRFTAPIESDGRGAWVVVPIDVEAAFGAKRVPVSATIDGVPYRGSLVRMGGQTHVLGVLKEIREHLGKGAGDTVDVTLEHDLMPREVLVPDDLALALRSSPPASRVFESLAYSHRREYVRWIESAKREDTRARRVALTLEKLMGADEGTASSAGRSGPAHDGGG